MKTEYHNPRFGDVYYANLHGIGSTQSGYRPVVIFSNNTGNYYSKNVIVLPLTTKIKKENMPTHVIIRAQNSGLMYDSMVLCENPVCLPKDELRKFVTSLPNNCLSRIAEANIISTCAIAYINPKILESLWCKAYNLNAAYI